MTKQEINNQIKSIWTQQMQQSSDTLSEDILQNYEAWVQQKCQEAVAARQQPAMPEQQTAPEQAQQEATA